MWAMVVKEFRQVRRDRRTLAMMIVLPVVLLIVFGYAASFDVTDIRTVVVGPQADRAARQFRSPFHVVERLRTGDRRVAEHRLRDGDAIVAVVTGSSPPVVLIDGAELFSARAAQAALARLGADGLTAAPALRPRVVVLFNPGLKTSVVMVPGLAGMILVFVGMVITSLGVVRERQTGTLEQLAVMPLRPWDVILGKIAPYFLVGAVDLTATIVIGVAVFHVPFTGSVATFALASALFLSVTLGMGVLISTVSENQGQAIQLALMTLLPQVLLSGLVFPVSSMAPGVRWISYGLPLTYFIRLARGVMLRGAPIHALWEPLVLLAVLGVVVLGSAVLRFRRDLAPTVRTRRVEVDEAAA